MAAAAPRCGRPLRRYECIDGPPVLEKPSCGRPDGHHGPCRSPRSLARAVQADVRRQARPRECACGCGDLATWGEYRRGHNARDAAGYWTRSEAA